VGGGRFRERQRNMKKYYSITMGKETGKEWRGRYRDETDREKRGRKRQRMRERKRRTMSERQRTEEKEFNYIQLVS
jgi:hypothetical protein